MNTIRDYITEQDQDRYDQRAIYNAIINDMKRENLPLDKKLDRLYELARAHAELVFETHPNKISDLDEAIQGVSIFMGIIRNLCFIRGIQNPDEAFELFAGDTELAYFWGFEGIFSIEMARSHLI
jgi:hypothetical protein